MAVHSLMSAARGPVRHKLSVADFERMVEAGILEPDRRVELLEGELIDMAPIGPPHASVSNRINRVLVERTAGRAVVSVQNPLKLPPHSMPQPDFLVLRPRGDDYGFAHPGADDVLLAVEVADTSLHYDRTQKAKVYAAYGIVEYWIVEAAGRRLHRHLQPRLQEARYAVVDVLTPPFEVEAQALPQLRLASGELWPDSGAAE